jgi:hypothetical protein
VSTRFVTCYKKLLASLSIVHGIFVGSGMNAQKV